MGLFDNFHMPDLSDPQTAARIRGALLGAGQAAAQPYGNLGSIAAGAGLGQQQGLQQYQQNQSNQMGLANDRLGMQQKLGSVNFLRNLQGQTSLTIDDVMKGNFAPMGTPAVPPVSGSMPSAPSVAPVASQAAPMGVPMTGMGISPTPAAQTSQDTSTPQPIGNAPLGQALDPTPIPNAPLNPQITATPLQTTQPQALIPDDLKNNPLFQAALQSGDATTVMSLLSKHQTQLTQQQLTDNHLPSDTLAFKAPDGTIDIKRQGTLKTPEQIAQDAVLKHKEVLTPDQARAAGLRPGTIATKDANGDIAILQEPDVKSPEAEAQAERISAADAKAHQTAMVDLLGPDYIDNQAKAIATYRAQPQQSSRNPAVTAAIMGRVYEMNPGYDAKQYQAANRAVTAFDTGKQGDQVRSFNTSIAHLNTLQQLAGALGNGDIKAVNSISNTFKDQFGKPAPTNFDAAKNIVGDEIIKAIIGGGGALADRENAQNQVSRANSPAQLAGVIQTYKNLMAGQLVSLKKQYEGSSHLNDFNDKLLPETQKELGNIGAAAPAALPVQAVQMLKMNPKLRSDFDAKYGPGSAAAVLGK